MAERSWDPNPQYTDWMLTGIKEAKWGTTKKNI
jgi:hypothetical protein